MLSGLTGGVRSLLRATAVVLFLALGFLLQVYFLRKYPQPILFGDPGAYYVFGQKFQAAFAMLLDGASWSEAFDSVRGYLFFAGVGLLYAGIDAFDPADIPTFRLVLAGLNVLGMLGAFFLAREVSGRFGSGLTALAIAAFYPSFALQIGRIYPDPVVSALLVWSAYFFVRGVASQRSAYAFAGGLALSAALFVRAQMFDYILLLLVATAVASARFWVRKNSLRKTVVVFGAGTLPLLLLFKLSVWSMNGDFREIERYGFFAAPQQQRYPYGFWLFLDSDGWIGPYSLDSYPFYRALEAEAEDEEDPELLTSRARQYAFTARYVGARPWESLGLVVDNVYRLFSHPANQYRWDYPFPVRVQEAYQCAIVLLGVAGIAFVATERTRFLFAFFMPVAVALLHALSFPEARYNQPVMLILVSAAAVYLGELGSRCHRMAEWPRRRTIAFGALVAGTLALFASAEMLREPMPSGARVALVCGAVGLVTLPFLLVHLLTSVEKPRWGLVSVAFATLCVVLVHHLRDRLWHEDVLVLNESYAGVEQQISLAGPAVAELRDAEAVWLFIDLHLDEGDATGLYIDVNGQRFSGTELVPTMPRFGTATTSGARNPRGYPQWWALPVPSRILPERAPAVVTVRVVSDVPRPTRIFSDRFDEQHRVYEGPSFGDRENHSVLKLVHDGDYRIARRIPLGSVRTDSWVLTRNGGRVPTERIFRVRLLTLSSVDGYLAWNSEPVPTSDLSALAFFAYSGRSGEAELVVSGNDVIRFPLGSARDFELAPGVVRLCHRAQAPRSEMAYGGYLILGRFDPGEPVSLAARFRSGPSDSPMFVSLDRGASPEALRELAEACQVPDETPLVKAAGTILDSDHNSYPENTGPWRVGHVF